jgi:hypothetical protein
LAAPSSSSSSGGCSSSGEASAAAAAAATGSSGSPLSRWQPPILPVEFIGPRLEHLAIFDDDLYSFDMHRRLAYVQPPLRQLHVTSSDGTDVAV